MSKPKLQSGCSNETISPADEIAGVRKTQGTVISEHAPDVIGMGMRDDDGRNVAGINTDGTQIAFQLAFRGLEAIAGADIDENDLVAGDEKRDVRLCVRRAAVATQSAQDLCTLFGIALGGKHLATQRNVAIGQNSDVELAVAETVKI
jgi:hypothetical protein